MQHPRIAIIGSGPSGLAPAKLFLNRSTVPHVFERDLSTDFRPQGGTHDLHEHSVSRQSVRLALGKSPVNMHATTARRPRSLPRRGRSLYSIYQCSNEGDRNTSSRTTASICEPSCSSRWDLTLSAGDTFSSRLNQATMVHTLCASRTERSRAATTSSLEQMEHGLASALITSIEPFYPGVSFVELNIPLPEGSKYDEIYALVGRGSVYAFGDQKEIMAQR
ncbi:hypothetical protein FRC08_003282 [Ceratobasidium sp. 394]|nr:hypothetical protein FRC08_003282 [Ceratobasidium sp. 394]